MRLQVLGTRLQVLGMRLQGLGMRLLSEVEHLKTLADLMLVSLTHSTSLQRVETELHL